MILEDLEELNLKNPMMKPSKIFSKESLCLSCLISIDKSGFYLNVVPYSHLMDPEFSEFHRFQVLRIWIPNNCFVIFHKRLLHGGCKSEYDVNKKLIPDNRVFCYLIPSRFNEGDSDFPDHREVYPPENAHNCAYLNGRQGHCNTCHMRGFDRDSYYTIDPCLLYDKGYDTVNKEFPQGHVIFGNVEKMGFAIMTGPKVTHPLRTKIYSLRDHFKSVHSGLTEQTGRCMVIPPSELSNALISQEEKMNGKNTFNKFLSDIVEKVEKALNLDHQKLQFYKPNIIFNRSDIPIDQKVHFDYIYEVSEKPVVSNKSTKRKHQSSTKTNHNKINDLSNNSLAKVIETNKKRKRTKIKKTETKTQYYLTSSVALKRKSNK